MKSSYLLKPGVKEGFNFNNFTITVLHQFAEGRKQMVVRVRIQADRLILALQWWLAFKFFPYGSDSSASRTGQEESYPPIMPA